MFSGGGLLPICYCSDFVWVRLHLPALDNVPKVTHGAGVEFTLFCFDKQFILQESLQNLTDMGDVFRLVLGQD